MELVAAGQIADADAEIYNNTAYQCDTMVDSGLSGNPYLRKANLHDNIFSKATANDGIFALGWYTSDTYNIADWRSSYNMFHFDTSTTKFLYHQGVKKSFSQAMSYLGDTTSSSGAVTFVDAPNHDFHLAPGSRAINAGTGGIDVGAIPYD